MAFKVQTNLDLNGFNLENFCIQPYTNVDSLSKTLARKVFVDGNENAEFYLREAIYDGSKWKATAYMEDIAAITDGETGLGARVSALEEMLGLEDVTDVIDTWEDVKNFFEGISEELDLMTMLNGKLDKTGGTITIDTINSLEIKRNGELSAILFSNTNGTLGYLGVNEEHNPIFASSVDGVSYVLLHKNNYADLIGNTYLKTTGGTIDGTLTIGGALTTSGLATFNGGAYIPTGQTIRFGDATNGYVTAEYDSEAKALKFNGNIYATGTVSSSGHEDEEGEGESGVTVKSFDVPIGSTSIDCAHGLNTSNVIVQVYEIDGNDGSLNLILTDVNIATHANVVVHFGRATTVNHVVHIIG